MCALVAAAPKHDVPLPPRPPPPPPPTTAPSLLHLTMFSPPSSGPSVPSRPRPRLLLTRVTASLIFSPAAPLSFAPHRLSVELKVSFLVKRRCGGGKEQRKELCSRMILKLLDLKREDVAV
uniref:Uncharacterized protein n=1 Tax=Triticum urartu TaxID=4572 RepID=A0A8R7PDZ6_TRIUA